MNLQRTERDSFVNIFDFATYLGFPRASIAEREKELLSAIERATTIIENRYNVSLRDMTISLRSYSDRGIIKLYLLDVAEIISVTDRNRPIQYNAVMGEELSIAQESDNIIEVVYKTKAICDAQSYMPEVMAKAQRIFNDEK